MKPHLIIALLTLASLHAQEAVNMNHVRTAAQWLNSPEATKRKAAITTFRAMPAAAMAHYKTALAASQKHHAAQLKELDRGEHKLAELDDATRQLNEERKRVIELIRIDYKKDEKKISMLREEMETLSDLYDKATKLAKADHTATTTGITSAIDALTEIETEIKKLTPTEEVDEEPEEPEELRARIISDSLEAEHLTEQLAILNSFRTTVTALTDTEKHNADAGRWCSASMKSFATLLNRERAVCGLSPLKIDERLSAASEGHSGDMARLGFFAHDSPVPNKKTPWDRARLAEFDGNASGENIFMGSANHDAAYGGWFGSDGHRFIMFADGPNCCGIGVSGIHWTYMTGSKK